MVILTAGVVVTWFIPPRLATLCLGATLLAAAVMSDILKVHSETGYTAAGLILVTGVIIAWRK